MKHTAFIELNKEAVVKTLYSDDDYQKYWGFRVLAVDGSKIMLPTNKMQSANLEALSGQMATP